MTLNETSVGDVVTVWQKTRHGFTRRTVEILQKIPHRKAVMVKCLTTGAVFDKPDKAKAEK